MACSKPMPVVEAASLGVPPLPARHRGAGWLSLAPALAGVIWLAAVGERVARQTAVTVDEPGHLAAGVSYWQSNSFALSTGNFFFTQKWAAWPLADHPMFPSPRAQQAWHWDANRIGARFLTTAAGHPNQLLLPARRMTLLLALATAALAGIWAHALGGLRAAAFAVFLYATSPVVLANATLVTTDTGAALWYTVGLFAYSRMLDRPSFVVALAAGTAIGLLTLSKFSLPAFALSAALVLGWHLAKNRRRHSLALLAGCHGALLVTAWVTIWAFFAGADPVARTTPSPGTPPAAGAAAWAQRVADTHLLPLPISRQLLETSQMLAPRPGYLFGEFRAGGHAAYFVVAFLVKSTLALLLALALAACIRRRPVGDAPVSPSSLMPIALAAAGYLIAATVSGLNIGVRHILPVFVLATIMGGVALARAISQEHARRKLAVAILVLGAIEAASAARRPVAWFNLLAGGPTNGHRVLIDSSLEWGGDLPELVDWQRALPATERARPLFVSLLAPPLHHAYGLHAEDLVWAAHHGRMRPGYFIFSATRLLGGSGLTYGVEPAELARRSRHLSADATQRPLCVSDAELVASRLAAFCRARPPDLRIGPAYFVFRLGPDELAAALTP